MAILIAHLEDSSTGQCAKVVQRYPWIEREGAWRSLWYWVEGNYGCDCNRGSALGLSLPCNAGKNRIRLRRLWVDGEVFENETELNDA